MNKECLRCKTKMEEAYQANSHSFIIQRKEPGLKGVFAKTSEVNVLVCPNCGYVELTASKPEIFQ
ncbi:MAG: DNA-directed RNA polymerase subunit RPC12/RpoP [Clostridium sp.]|jgi:DNA-directed RNA polymerase subunit RPC12/RpoP